MIFCIGAHTIRMAPGRVTTTLHDGAVVHAVPHDTADYRATAARLGYGTDTAAMNADHEITHALLAAWLGLDESPVMRAVADDAWQDGPAALGLEEDAVLAVQRLARAWGVELAGVVHRLDGV